MSRGRTILAGGALLLAAAVLWTRTSRQEELAGAEPARDAQARVPTGSDLGRGAVDEVTNPPGLGTSGRIPLVAEEPAAGLLAGPVLDGRIVLPPGTPAGERIDVLIRHEGDPEPLRVETDPERRFQVQLDDSMLPVNVRLDADHLFLTKSVQIARSEFGQELVLQPELGARILGRVELPPGCSQWRERLVGSYVALNVSFGDCELGADHTQLDEQLGFQFDGVGMRFPMIVELHADPFPVVRLGGWGEDRLRLEPGGDFLVILPLKIAAAVHGRIDWSTAGLPREVLREVVICVEQPVPGQEALLEYQFLGEPWHDARGGTFSVGSLLSRPARVHVAAPGCVPVELVLDSLEDCEDRDLGTIVLERGLTLAGRVVLEDGSPADCAVVLIDDPTSPPRPGVVPECVDENSHTALISMDATCALADHEGAFEVRGLGPGPWKLVAQHFDSRGISRTSRVDRLGPSSGELLVEVRRPPLIHGVLSAPDGEPIPSYVQLRAECDEAALQGRRTAKIDWRTGRYEFDSLFPGRWRLYPAAPGYRGPEAVVELETSDVELDISLERLPEDR